MLRDAAAWLVVSVSGVMILPKSFDQMIHFPWVYAPLAAIWLAKFMIHEVHQSGCIMTL